MYQVSLTESCFPAQDDAQIWDITTGELLRDALFQEWWNSKPVVSRGIKGAGEFAAGAGRGGVKRDG